MKRYGKKLYSEPDLKIEKFTLCDVITSSSQDDHDEPIEFDEF